MKCKLEQNFLSPKVILTAGDSVGSPFWMWPPRLTDRVCALLANKAQRTVQISSKVQACVPLWHWRLATKDTLVCKCVQSFKLFLKRGRGHFYIAPHDHLNGCPYLCCGWYQCKDSIVFRYISIAHFLQEWHLDRWVSGPEPVDILLLMSSCER